MSGSEYMNHFYVLVRKTLYYTIHVLGKISKHVASIIIVMSSENVYT